MLGKDPEQFRVPRGRHKKWVHQRLKPLMKKDLGDGFTAQLKAAPLQKMAMPHQSAEHGPDQATVILPSPTAYPFVMALGASLIMAGLLTNVSVSVLGAILWVVGAVGWFRQVLPHEHHETFCVTVPAQEKALAAPPVERLRVAEQVQRAWLP